MIHLFDWTSKHCVAKLHWRGGIYCSSGWFNVENCDITYFVRDGERFLKDKTEILALQPLKKELIQFNKRGIYIILINLMFQRLCKLCKVTNRWYSSFLFPIVLLLSSQSFLSFLVAKAYKRWAYIPWAIHHNPIISWRSLEYQICFIDVISRQKKTRTCSQGSKRSYQSTKFLPSQPSHLEPGRKLWQFFKRFRYCGKIFTFRGAGVFPGDNKKMLVKSLSRLCTTESEESLRLCER